MSKNIGFRGSINVNGNIVLTNSTSSFYINDKPVLSYNSLGDSIVNSNLTSVGTLSSLTVTGSTNVKNMTANNLFVDSITVTSSNNKTDNIIVESGSIENIVMTNGTASTLNIINGEIANLSSDIFTLNSGIITNCTITNLYSTNIYVPSITTDTLKSTSLYTNNASINNLFSSNLKTDNQTITNSTISQLYTDIASSSNFYATSGTVSSLYSNTCKIDNLYCINSTMSSFSVINGDISSLKSTYVSINDLYASNSTITNLNITSLYCTPSNNVNVLKIVNNNGECSLFNGYVNNNNFMGIGNNMTPSTYTTTALYSSSAPTINTSSIILNNNSIILSASSISLNTNSLNIGSGLLSGQQKIFVPSNSSKISNLYNGNAYLLYDNDNIYNTGVYLLYINITSTQKLSGVALVDITNYMFPSETPPYQMNAFKNIWLGSAINNTDYNIIVYKENISYSIYLVATNLVTNIKCNLIRYI